MPTVNDRSYQQAIAWLVKLESPERDAATETEFFAWLEAAPANQLAYIKAESLWQRGEVLGQVDEQAVNSRAMVFGVWGSVGIAATLVFSLAIYLFLPYDEYSEKYQTALGEIRNVSLPDGSKLVLNTDSSVRVELSNTERKVFLDKGEVFFDVQHKQKRPFDIVVPSGVIRVLGTRFSVFEYDNSYVVTVMDGEVALGQVGSARDQFMASAVLRSNQRLSLEQAEQGVAAETVVADEVLAWRQERLVYRGSPLIRVIEDLNRHYSTKIILGDDSLAELEVVATIQISDFDTTLATITASLNLRSEADLQRGVVALFSP